MSDEIQRWLFYDYLFNDMNESYYDRILEILDRFGWKLGKLQLGERRVLFPIFKVLPDDEIKAVIETAEKHIEEMIKAKGNPYVVYIFTHPVYIVDDIIYRLHGFCRELQRLVYFNASNDFVDAPSAYSTVAHEIIHLALVGETEEEVRQLEAKFIAKYVTVDSPIVKMMGALLAKYRREIDEVSLKMLKSLNIDFQPTAAKFDALKLVATRTEDIIFYGR